MPDKQHFWIDPTTGVATGPDTFQVPKPAWDQLSRVPCPDCDEMAQLEPLEMWDMARGQTYKPNGKWTCPNGCHLKGGTNQ
ncbi:MAG: hypothetical protein ACRD3Q_15385 [Terriglobales bacterium]